MKYSEMIKGIKYIVTKSSDDYTFLSGDEISICKNNDVFNYTVDGWTTPENMNVAEKGLEIEMCFSSLKKEKERLIRNLNLVDSLLNTKC